MQLMTNELEQRFVDAGSQEHIDDKLIIAKFFFPGGCQTWWATEYNPRTRLFFGFVLLFDDAQGGEWGYFSLDELQNLRVRGLGIERDLYFGEKRCTEIKKIMEQSPWIGAPV